MMTVGAARGEDKESFGKSPPRAAIGEGPMRLILPRGYKLVIPLALLVAYIAVAGNAFATFTAALILAYAVAALAQDWLIGRAGQISIGGAALMAVGAYSTATLSQLGINDLLVAMLVSATIGGLVGCIVCIPAIRLRGLYLLLSTLALHFIVTFAVQQYEDKKYPGGLAVDPATLLGWHISGGSTVIVFAAILSLSGLFLASADRSAPGRRWQAVRESELAAAVLGVNCTRAKLTAFIGSSALTSIAGAMYAHILGIVSYTSFTLDLAISFIVMIFVGGLRTFSGPILGACFVGLMPYLLQQLAKLIPTGSQFGNWFGSSEPVVANGFYGLALLIVLLVQPGGVVVAGPRTWRRITKLASSIVSKARRGSVGQSHDTARDGHGDRAGDPPDCPSRSADSGTDPAADNVLRVEHLSVRYRSGAVALQDFSFTLKRSEAIAIVGRNGAGKTSTVRALMGFPRQEGVEVGGSIQYSSAAPTRMSSLEIPLGGIVLVPERDKICPSLTVAEHLRIATASSNRRSELLESFPILEQRKASKAGLLSGGERQIVAIALAWARNPAILMIDEVSLGLAPVAIAAVMEHLVRIQESGTSLILIDQDLSMALRICGRTYVLDHGLDVTGSEEHGFELGRL